MEHRHLCYSASESSGLGWGWRRGVSAKAQLSCQMSNADSCRLGFALQGLLSNFNSRHNRERERLTFFNLPHKLWSLVHPSVLWSL